jgi:hypothetical protein
MLFFFELFSLYYVYNMLVFRRNKQIEIDTTKSISCFFLSKSEIKYFGLRVHSPRMPRVKYNFPVRDIKMG